jgi:uncharacterized membrane protein YbhN (UPF0104 family)
LRYILGGALVYWLLKTESIDLAVIELIDLEVALKASLISIVYFIFAGLRIEILLRSIGVKVGLLQCILYNSVGSLFSNFLPGGISGDFVRAYYFLSCEAVKATSKTALISVLIMDRLIGCFVLILIGLIASTFVSGTLGIDIKYFIAAWLIFFLAGLLIYYVIRIDLVVWAESTNMKSSKFFIPLALVFKKMSMLVYSRIAITQCLVISCVIHLTAISLIALFSNLLKASLSIWQIMGLAPFGLLVNMVPISPGGIGIGEQGFQLLFELAGGDQGGNTFLLSRIFFSSSALLGFMVLVNSFIKMHYFLINPSLKYDLEFNPSEFPPESKTLKDGEK